MTTITHIHPQQAFDVEAIDILRMIWETIA